MDQKSVKYEPIMGQIWTKCEQNLDIENEVK